MHAQKAPMPVSKRRERPGLAHIRTVLMHLEQSIGHLTIPLERNGQRDTAMLLTSLLNVIEHAKVEIITDCSHRGYGEVVSIAAEVRERVEATHQRRSENAKKHQLEKKRTRAEFEAASQKQTVAMKAPRTQATQTQTHAGKRPWRTTFAGEEEPDI